MNSTEVLKGRWTANRGKKEPQVIPFACHRRYVVHSANCEPSLPGLPTSSLLVKHVMLRELRIQPISVVRVLSVVAEKGRKCGEPILNVVENFVRVRISSEIDGLHSRKMYCEWNNGRKLLMDGNSNNRHIASHGPI